MFAQHVTEFFSTQISTAAAIGVGAAGLAAGLAWGLFASRDKVRRARHLMQIAVRYENAAEDTYAKIRALTTPTSQVPVVELFPPTWRDRMRARLAVAADRIATRAERETPPDWSDGDLRAFLDAELAQDEPATPYAAPVVPSPVAARPTPQPQPYRTYIPAVVDVQRARQMPRGVTVTGRQRFGPPIQRKPSPLLFAKLPADPLRELRVKVLEPAR
jgi:hypothetical protein